jgi:hypothetical protein
MMHKTYRMSTFYLEEMRASAHCAKKTTGAETRGIANLGNPSVKY